MSSGVGYSAAGGGSSGKKTISFPFPFPPYPQQQELMQAIYDCIDSSSVGCFESPTGTGKSLSAICSALHWQRLEEQRILKEQEETMAKQKAAAATVVDDWLMEFQTSHANENSETKEKTKAFEAYQSMTERVRRVSLEGTGTGQGQVHGQSRRGTFTGFMQGSAQTVTSKLLATSAAAAAPSSSSSSSSSGRATTADDPDEEFALAEYDSDREKPTAARKGRGGRVPAASAAALRYADSDDSDGADDEDGLVALKLPQVFYCSRTHSQIAQFVAEIKRTTFADVRVVTLGSRRNMCINPAVAALKSDGKISEACLELGKKTAKKGSDPPSSSCGGCSAGAGASATAVASTAGQPAAKRQKPSKPAGKSTGPCPYHQRGKEARLADHALSRIRDIEDLVTLGTALETCPYYATRRAVQAAQVVCLPYNMLLHADLRASLGLRLDHAVVVFDEAHNLVDAVNHMHSADVSRNTEPNLTYTPNHTLFTHTRTPAYTYLPCHTFSLFTLSSLPSYPPHLRPHLCPTHAPPLLPFHPQPPPLPPPSGDPRQPPPRRPSRRPLRRPLPVGPRRQELLLHQRAADGPRWTAKESAAETTTRATEKL